MDDPDFIIEPARWPVPYARTVKIDGDPPVPAPNLAVFSLSSAGFLKLLSGTGLNGAEVLECWSRKVKAIKVHHLVPGR